MEGELLKLVSPDTLKYLAIIYLSAKGIANLFTDLKIDSYIPRIASVVVGVVLALLLIPADTVQGYTLSAVLGFLAGLGENYLYNLTRGRTA